MKFESKLKTAITDSSRNIIAAIVYRKERHRIDPRRFHCKQIDRLASIKYEGLATEREDA